CAIREISPPPRDTLTDDPIEAPPQPAGAAIRRAPRRLRRSFSSLLTNRAQIRGPPTDRSPLQTVPVTRTHPGAGSRLDEPTGWAPAVTDRRSNSGAQLATQPVQVLDRQLADATARSDP